MMGRIHKHQRGFSLIEQIVSVGLVAVIIPSMALLLSSLVQQASTSGAEVAMLTLARSQIESVKEQPYQGLPAAYDVVSPVPSEFSIQITAACCVNGSTVPLRTYTYPAPQSTTTLPDEVQLITVEVICPDCSPPVGSLILQGYKVRR